MALTDGCGRPLLHLRVAVTQQCNLHCAYCHREGEERHFKGIATEMDLNEIVRIVRVAVRLGVSKIKLTGGEPLMRKDIIEIVREIGAIEGLKDLSMTTNGTQLSFQAKELRQNGLRRININLPSLNAEVYKKLTGGRVENVIAGVQMAVEVGFWPVKLNMVILKGVNTETVPEMIKFAGKTGAILQLIELDPVNVDNEYYSLHHKPLDEYEGILRKNAFKIETREFMHNRRVYCLQDVMVETVRPIENAEFCMHCTRLRVTSDGKLKSCLMRNDNLVDVLTPMRYGASDRKLMELFEIANKARKPYNRCE